MWKQCFQGNYAEHTKLTACVIFFFNLVGYFILISWLGGEVGCNPLSTHVVINSKMMNDEDFKELTLQHSCVNFFKITFT